MRSVQPDGAPGAAAAVEPAPGEGGLGPCGDGGGGGGSVVTAAGGGLVAAAPAAEGPFAETPSSSGREAGSQPANDGGGAAAGARAAAGRPLSATWAGAAGGAGGAGWRVAGRGGSAGGAANSGSGAVLGGGGSEEWSSAVDRSGGGRKGSSGEGASSNGGSAAPGALLGGGQQQQQEQQQQQRAEAQAAGAVGSSERPGSGIGEDEEEAEEDDGTRWDGGGGESEEGDAPAGTGAAAAAADSGVVAAEAGAAAAAAAAAEAALYEAARWQGWAEGAVDVAADPGLALRLVDVMTLDDIMGGGSGDVTGDKEGGGGYVDPYAHARPAVPDVVADVVVGDARARMRARPPRFCANCCAPLERLPSGGGAPCGVCGHRPEDDAQILPPRPAGGWGRTAAGAGGDAGDARAAAAAAMLGAAAAARGAGVPCAPAARVLLAYHEDCLLHRGMLPPHPERPERLHAVLARLQEAGLLAVCELMPVEEATDEQLLAAHSPGLVTAIDALGPDTAFPEQLAIAGVGVFLESDSLGNRRTARAARLAAGAAAGMAARLARGEADAGFALVRPAGHLTSEGNAEGGNLYNNVAVAARAAQRAGADRVMIVDWDAHAAKGTAAIFEDDPSVMVVSLHKSGSWFYPGACPLSQVGRGAASGTTVNIAWAAPPRPPGARRGDGLSLDDVQPGGGDYLAAITAVVAPLAREWGPDLILVSAGFDSAEGDPVGLGSVPPPVFAHMTSMLRALGPPVGMVLEGGYVLKQTALCTELCVRALLGERPPPLPPGASTPTPVGWNTLVRTLAVHQHFWRSLGMLSLAAAAATSGAAGAAAGAAAAGAGAGAGAGAAALEALLAAAGGGGDEEGGEWEGDEDGEWEEEGEEEGEGAAMGPGEWASDSA